MADIIQFRKHGRTRPTDFTEMQRLLDEAYIITHITDDGLEEEEPTKISKNVQQASKEECQKLQEML